MLCFFPRFIGIVGPPSVPAFADSGKMKSSCTWPAFSPALELPDFLYFAKPRHIVILLESRFGIEFEEWSAYPSESVTMSLEPLART